MGMTYYRTTMMSDTKEYHVQLMTLRDVMLAVMRWKRSFRGDVKTAQKSPKSDSQASEEDGRLNECGCKCSKRMW